MVKTLDVDATYEIAKRSHNWLKVCVDELPTIATSFSPWFSHTDAVWMPALHSMITSFTLFTAEEGLLGRCGRHARPGGNRGLLGQWQTYGEIRRLSFSYVRWGEWGVSDNLQGGWHFAFAVFSLRKYLFECSAGLQRLGQCSATNLFNIFQIGTGFKDEDLEKHTAFFKEHVVEKAKPYYCYENSLAPDHWFDSVQVWEIKAADLSVSPVHKAAAGLVRLLLFVIFFMPPQCLLVFCYPISWPFYDKCRDIFRCTFSRLLINLYFCLLNLSECFLFFSATDWSRERNLVKVPTIPEDTRWQETRRRY